MTVKKRINLVILLLAALLLCPLLSSAEDVTVDSRIASIVATFECGCESNKAGTMISQYGMVTKSCALYCDKHGKKYKDITFYFGHAGDGVCVYKYTGAFTFHVYETFPNGFKSENDIAYIKFAEPVGDTTGWYAIKGLSDREFRSSSLIYRRNTNGGIQEASIPSFTIDDKKFLYMPYEEGLAYGVPVFKTDGNGEPEYLVGIINSYTYNDTTQRTYIRRITSRVFNDMTSDGLFQRGGAKKEPTVTSVWKEPAEEPVETALPSTVQGNAASGSWNCPECGKEGNTGNFCSDCGAAKPAEEASGEWTCPNCGREGNTGNFCPTCGTKRGTSAAPAATEEPQTTVNSHLEQIRGESNKVKVRLAGTTANTYIPYGQDPTRWQPSNATDGNETTCWQYSGSEATGCLNLDVGTGEAVDEIWFKNGFWGFNDKGIEQYTLNARPKSITIEFSYEGANQQSTTQNITLADDPSKSDWQRFSVGHLDGVTGVRITVNSYYKGSSFANDVCISEVMLVQYAAAETALAAAEEQAAVTYESRPEITGCKLTMKIATRSGPGSRYAEPGTFFAKNYADQVVKVLKKDYHEGVWWVQIDFQNGTKAHYRVWTGSKRVDVDLDKVEQEVPLGDCDVHPTRETYYGPGGNYAKSKIYVTGPAVGTVYEILDGYADVEFEDVNGVHDRVWVPVAAIYNLDTNKDRSGGK